MRKDARLELRLTQAEEQMLDKKRGDLTRSEWVRRQIRDDGGQTGLITIAQPPEYTTGIDHAELYIKPEVAGHPHPEPHPDPLPPEEPEVETIPQNPQTSGPHRHRGEEVASRTVKGVTVKTLKCTVEGCTRTWER